MSIASDEIVNMMPDETVLQLGDTVEDLVGMRGKVVEIADFKVKVQWAEHTWIKKSFLVVVK